MRLCCNLQQEVRGSAEVAESDIVQACRKVCASLSVVYPFPFLELFSLLVQILGWFDKDGISVLSVVR